MDLFFVGLFALLFAASAALVYGLEKLRAAR
jgi:hypothetical protein